MKWDAIQINSQLNNKLHLLLLYIQFIFSFKIDPQRCSVMCENNICSVQFT